MLLESRRSQERGCVVGVPDRDGASSPFRVPARSMLLLPLPSGVNVRFCPTLGRAFPYCPSLTDREEGGVEEKRKGKGESRLNGRG